MIARDLARGRGGRVSIVARDTAGASGAVRLPRGWAWPALRSQSAAGPAGPPANGMRRAREGGAAAGGGPAPPVPPLSSVPFPGQRRRHVDPGAHHGRQPDAPRGLPLQAHQGGGAAPADTRGVRRGAPPAAALLPRQAGTGAGRALTAGQRQQRGAGHPQPAPAPLQLGTDVLIYLFLIAWK